ncbi:hypothetical protein OHR68_42010 [Spirillospora sp. NBC_00431]
MAGDAAWAGAVAVPPRRVAVVGRVVRRMLVLGGLLIAGWLLGCAAQSAQADELPAAPSRLVAEAPVLGHAVDAATARPPVSPVPDVVRVEDPPPKESVAVEEPVTRGVVPPVEVSESPPEVGEASVTGGVRVSRPHRAAHVVVSAQTVEMDDGHVSRRIVRHHPAPPQAPEWPDDHSAAGALAVSGATAGFSNAVMWAPAPSRAPSVRLPGTVPPAVRTAADEPSFAPD